MIVDCAIVLRTEDRVEAIDALLTSVLSANLAQVGVRQNEDMRREWL